jgi:thioredoxin-related protein
VIEGATSALQFSIGPYSTMSKVHQRIELTANFLIIVVAVLLIGLFISKQFLTPKVTDKRNGPKIGSKLSLPGMDLSKTDRALLLVLQKGCHFCSESADFYKALISRANTKNLKVFAILPNEKNEAEEYLRSLGIENIETRQMQLSALEVVGTPTIMLIKSNGEVSNSWMGKLSNLKEREVFDTLKL